MPFNELQRRDSWPPTIVRIDDPSTHTSENPTDLSDIDENPISFFLTSPEDDLTFYDYDDDLDLSAGIEGSPESKSQVPVREVSPSSLQRSSLPPLSHQPESDEDEEIDIDDFDDEEVEFGVGMPLTLKDFTARHSVQNNNGRESRAGERDSDDEELMGLGIDIPVSARMAKRGRPKVRLIPNTGRGRGTTRSLSTRRAQSWRVPSPDIYSIEEEKEGEAEMSVSAPVTSQIEQVEMMTPPAVKKVKKRVHWAI